jgi:curved DNA-binding protein CbpA
MEPIVKASYKELGIEQGCSRDVMVKAFRRIAKATHPDHNASPDIARFRRATLAYATLLDVIPKTGKDLICLPSDRRATLRRLGPEHRKFNPMQRSQYFGTNVNIMV